MKVLYSREIWESLGTCGYLLLRSQLKTGRAQKRAKVGQSVACSEFQRRAIEEIIEGLDWPSRVGKPYRIQGLKKK